VSRTGAELAIFPAADAHLTDRRMPDRWRKDAAAIPPAGRDRRRRWSDGHAAMSVRNSPATPKKYRTEILKTLTHLPCIS